MPKNTDLNTLPQGLTRVTCDSIELHQPIIVQDKTFTVFTNYYANTVDSSMAYQYAITREAGTECELFYRIKDNEIWRPWYMKSGSRLYSPNVNNSIEISNALVNTADSNIKNYTPTADGIVSIHVKNCYYIKLAHYHIESFIETSDATPKSTFIPVLKNITMKVEYNGTLGWARFVPYYASYPIREYNN